MKEYTVRKYTPEDFTLWNEFIAKAKNSTFLFHRNFMEYHKDRFEDFSLLVFDENKLVATLPANRVGDEVHSHQGLTYGSLVINRKTGFSQVEIIFNSIYLYLKNNSLKKFKIKSFLPFYSAYNSDELFYILWNKGAKNYNKYINLAIDYSKELQISKSKLKHFRKIDSLNLEIRKDDNFDVFWNQVLTPKLNDKYNTKPVHSLSEIKKLKAFFPENIAQYNVYRGNTILAGITLFVSENVIKSQYGATTNEGEKYRALDYLFISLIYKFKDEYSFFDMGTVNNSNLNTYNEGLLKQKEELGCSVYIQDFYELDLD